MLLLLRFILLVIVLFLLIRAVIRFFAVRLLKQEWPFNSLNRNSGNRTAASGAAQEADFEVIETTLKEHEETS